MSTDLAFKILSAIAAALFLVAGATAEYKREKDKRFRWLLAVTGAGVAGILALALIYREREAQIGEQRRQLEEGRRANLQRDSLNSRLDEHLRRLTILNDGRSRVSSISPARRWSSTWITSRKCFIRPSGSNGSN